MAWVFNSKQCGRDGVHFYIGQVKIAEIRMHPQGNRWKYYLRLMLSDVTYDVRDQYETFSEALTDLHRLLGSPPPEGHKVSGLEKPK